MFSTRVLDEEKDSGYFGAMDIAASRYPEVSNFLQSNIWYNFQKSLGKKVFALGLFYNDVELMGHAVMTEEEIPKVGKFLYSPRGPVLKNQVYDEMPELAEKFYNFIRRFARENKYVFVRIEPPILTITNTFSQVGKNTPLTPLEGRITKKTPSSEVRGMSNGIREKNSESYSVFFKKAGFQRSYKNYIQPTSTSILNLEPNLEDLLKSFHSKTRYNIRLSDKKGVKIAVGGSELIDDFWLAISETADRNEISIHEKDYYQKQVEAFESAKHFPAEAKIFVAKFDGEILAANVCIGFHDTFIYLHGGSRNLHRNLMAPHALQWEQMKYAKKTCYTKYDFWGIDRFGDIPNWQGITRFKKGFNGEEITHFPLLDFPIDTFKYKILKMKENFKHKIKNVRS